MKKTKCDFPIFVFFFATVFIFTVFTVVPEPVFADNGYKEKNGRLEWQKQKEQNRKNWKQQRESEGKHHKHYEKQEHRQSKKHPNLYIYNGYRDRPYDKRRHYRHQDFKGHRYSYHGHWRSWEQWDKYARKYPHIYKHGRYYRENKHLMFRYCEPESGNCIFFSIGR